MAIYKRQLALAKKQRGADAMVHDAFDKTDPVFIKNPRQYIDYYLNRHSNTRPKY